MKKVEHLGTVVGIEGALAVVQVKAGRSCSSGLSCACCSSFRPEPLTIRVARDGLEQGDTVGVLIPAYAGAVGTFVVFILPIMLAVVGFVVGGRFESGTGAHGMPTIVGGVVGFLLAAGVAAVVNRRLSRPDNYEVRRVTEGERDQQG